MIRLEGPRVSPRSGRCAALGMAMLLHVAAACSPSPPTWNQDVAPILAEHCMSCHRDGGLAPFSLTDYESAKETAGRMMDQVVRGVMPPFSAQSDADCAPRFGLRDDPRLSESEKDTLREWMAGGYLLGEPAKPPPIASPDLANVSMTLVPAAQAGWTTSGERDQFICYLFDVGNTEMAWLTGL
ncbi:MAG TPA: cytochrome c, partial [Kofleriaceae bacterium]|nr:cytochrome c [Kofleriaceae bacterium]